MRLNFSATPLTAVLAKVEILTELNDAYSKFGIAHLK